MKVRYRVYGYDPDDNDMSVDCGHKNHSTYASAQKCVDRIKKNQPHAKVGILRLD